MKPLRLFLVAAAACSSPWATPGYAIGPVTHTWPTDPPPCDANATLQVCIDSAASGDTVLIATNGPIDESIQFQKSLTLRAAQYFHPLFSATRTIRAQTPTTGSNAIAIEGLALEHGFIHVDQSSAEPLTVAILANTIKMSLGSSAIQVDSIGSGTVALDISHNALTASAASLSGIQVGFAANASGRIDANTIASESESAIRIFNTDYSLSIEVVSNRISETNYGIFLTQDGAGTTEARVLDNLVGESRAVPGVSATAIYLGPDDTGTLTATVANNDLADSEYGISVSAGNANCLIANNIVSGNNQVGIDVNPSLGATVANRNNLVFGNGTDFRGTTPGPATIGLDPMFVDPAHGNYHLMLGSPAVDSGDDGAVPADLPTDLDGNPRTQGSHVDIGAFEAPAPGPAGAPRSFTGELQIEMGGSSLSPPLHGHGTAVLDTGVAPPSFVIPAGVFIAGTPGPSTRNGEPFATFLSLTKAMTRQLLSIPSGHNAQGTFASQVRQLPFSGILRFERIVQGSAWAAAIDASPIGAPGKTTVGFPYPTMLQVGTGMLTGQSFQVSQDSRTPAGGGHIQLVAPFSFHSSLTTFSGPTSVTLALDFAPEPSRLALGALAIAMLCSFGVATRRREARARLAPKALASADAAPRPSGRRSARW